MEITSEVVHFFEGSFLDIWGAANFAKIFRADSMTFK
jgi:hypothetical protein